MKKKSRQFHVRRYLSRKSFSFDLRFFQCCYLVLLIFLSTLLLSAIFYKLDKRFGRQDNPESLAKNISSQDS